MLNDAINEKLIQINLNVSNWKDAIRKSMDPLITENYVDQNYVEEIINTTAANGPYYVITKGIAIPHASSKYGAYKNGISITSLQHSVCFNHPVNDPVKLIIGLSSINGEEHLRNITKLVTLLEDSNFLNIVYTAKNAKEVYDYILNYKEGGEEKYV